MGGEEIQTRVVEQEEFVIMKYPFIKVFKLYDMNNYKQPIIKYQMS